MKVLVDTSIWSHALRRQRVANLGLVGHLTDLVNDLRVTMIGPVRQELLTGIADSKRAAKLREKLRAYDDIPLTSQDYERAAQLANICRRHGTQGSSTDFLICAVAIQYGLEIWTEDQDFVRYAKWIPITLHHFLIS